MTTTEGPTDDQAGVDAPLVSSWAAPESGADPRASTQREQTEWIADRRALEAPSVPVPLRPMTVADVLDGSWAILKLRPRTVLGISAVIVVPVVLVATWLATDLNRSSFDIIEAAFGGTGSQATRQTDPTQGLVRATGLRIIETLPYMLLGGAIGRLVSAWYAGGSMTAWQACMAAFKKAPALLAAWALLLLIKVPAMAICFSLPFVAIVPVTFFAVTAPAIVIEGLGPIAGIKRSATLVARRFWPSLLVVLLATLVETTIQTAVTSIPLVMSIFSVGGELANDVSTTVASTLAHLITAPVLVGASVLLYLDLRIRSEGLDLELEASNVFARA